MVEGRRYSDGLHQA
ncbi:MAG: hypothetical protein IPO60_18075 [Flavobacteriales bacterium]|nr:hypothetical protein [Flavobacteriales bacterium]